MSIAISIICWAGFWIYWFINNSNQKETKQLPNPKETLPYRILWTMAFVFLLLPKVFHLGFTVLPNNSFIGIVSIAASLLGLFVCIAARKTLAGNWSMQLDVKKNHELVTSGPYAFVRHPIYTGFLLLFLGSALAVNTAGAMVGLLLLIIGCYVRIVTEEKVMLKTFGEKYITYKHRVKALIPYIL